MDVLDLQQQFIDGLASLETGALSDDELSEAAVGLLRGGRRIAAQVARITAEYDGRRAWASDGSKTAAARLARETKSSPGEMRRQVRDARRLRLMPKVDAALAAGEIGVEHARLLGRLAASDRRIVAYAFPGAEEHLVRFAKTLSFKDFERALKYWEQVVDPDGPEERGKKLHDSRRLHLSQGLDGEWFLDGKLDPIAGTTIATALRRIDKELFAQDWAEAKATHGADTRPEHLARNPAQRRADALEELARRAMAAPAGARLPAPLVVIHVGYETHHGRLCELENGTVIPPGQLLPVMTSADFERVVWDAPDRIIQLSQRARFFTGGLREVIMVRDRHCQHPGCDVPASECHVDHIQEYEDGGLTTQDNGESKCDSHNWWKTNNKHPTGRGGKHSTTGNGREPPPDDG